MADPNLPPRWAKGWLLAAAAYNIAWGASVVAFPRLLFDIAGMDPPRYPQIWQCVGMIVGVYGIGYLVASTNSRVHWPIVLVGLLGKFLGPFGFLGALLQEELPLAFGATIVTNDLVWWVPFTLILWDAAWSRRESGATQPAAVDAALDGVTDEHGRTLGAITAARREPSA